MFSNPLISLPNLAAYHSFVEIFSLALLLMVHICTEDSLLSLGQVKDFVVHTTEIY